MRSFIPGAEPRATPIVLKLERVENHKDPTHTHHRLRPHQIEEPLTRQLLRRRPNHGVRTPCITTRKSSPTACQSARNDAPSLSERKSCRDLTGRRAGNTLMLPTMDCQSSHRSQVPKPSPQPSRCRTVDMTCPPRTRVAQSDAQTYNQDGATPFARSSNRGDDIAEVKNRGRGISCDTSLPHSSSKLTARSINSWSHLSRMPHSLRIR